MTILTTSYPNHSRLAGTAASLLTILDLNAANDSQITQQTKHCTRTMIDRYTRVQQVVRHNAAMKLRL